MAFVYREKRHAERARLHFVVYRSIGRSKITVSEIVEKELRAHLEKIEVLDDDIPRTNLSRGLFGSSVYAARSARKLSSIAT